MDTHVLESLEKFESPELDKELELVFTSSCNRKKNHEKSPSSLGGLKRCAAPLGNDPVWKAVVLLDLDGSTTH